MSTRRFRGRLGCLLGAALWLAACATPPEPLPRLAEGAKPATSQGLVPQEYLCPGGTPEAPDPRLVKEIQAFLEENGLLLGAPWGVAADLPIILNSPVKAYVRAFTTSQREVFETYLARSGRYLPLMRRIFQEYGLPPDLVYLCLVESGFSPWAVSAAEAVGPWQFIRGTARRYDLTMNGWVDERRDPEKSTRAAARYLKDLYAQFGCWYLAAAGYNAGEKRVERVVNRHTTRNFWTMAARGLLPAETCNYVPQIIAAALIAKNPQGYGFEGVHYQAPLKYEKVKVPGRTDLRWFARYLELDYQVIKELNPELNREAAPPGTGGYVLKVPPGKKRPARWLATLCWQMAEKETAD